MQLAQASRIIALGSNLGEHFLILFSLSFFVSISVFFKCCGRQNKVVAVVVVVVVVVALVVAVVVAVAMAMAAGAAEALDAGARGRFRPVQ